MGSDFDHTNSEKKKRNFILLTVHKICARAYVALHSYPTPHQKAIHKTRTMSTFDFMQTLFPPGSVSPDISKEDFAKEFDRRIKQLEGSGFLTKNGLPKIEGEEELTRKLAFHASQKQMVMIKYWKRGCIPCLAKAEMFKEVEGWILDNNPGCAFYSVDIKDPVNYDLSVC